MARVRRVALAVEVACAHGYGCTESVVHHKRKLRYGGHHLMRSQSDGAKPSHHDDRQRERSCLHTHFQSYRGAERAETSHQLARPSEAEESLTILLHTAFAEEYREKYAHHDDARHQCRYAGTNNTHFGHSHLAVYQYVVADDVEQIARQEYPHRRARLGDTVGELLEGIEQHDEGQRRKQH